MSAVLDVAIGLGFVFLTFSLLASTTVEWASALGDRRARFLQWSLRSCLGAELTDQLMTHPVIRGLVPPRPRSWRYSLPQASYLPPKAVALALADIARQAAQSETHRELNRLMRSLKSELDSPTGTQVLAVDGEILFRVERWFTEQMDRTTAGYKRWTQLWTVVVALCLTAAFDIDAGRIAHHLLGNAAARSMLAATAGQEVVVQTLAEVKPAVGQLADLPIGWTRPVSEALSTMILATLAGWTISIVAIGLGAPFWFDLLNRLVSLRQTGPRPSDSIVAG